VRAETGTALDLRAETGTALDLSPKSRAVPVLSFTEIQGCPGFEFPVLSFRAVMV
jgi:hypothetical protein